MSPRSALLATCTATNLKSFQFGGTTRRLKRIITESYFLDPPFGYILFPPHEDFFRLACRVRALSALSHGFIGLAAFGTFRTPDSLIVRTVLRYQLRVPQLKREWRTQKRF
jgi:hypothetical protein